MKKENMRKILNIVTVIIALAVVFEAIMVLLFGWSTVYLFCTVAILCANVAIGKIYYGEKNKK